MTTLTRETVLERGAVLITLVSLEQRRKFTELFEENMLTSRADEFTQRHGGTDN